MEMACSNWPHSRLANLVLQDTIERMFVKDVYADINRGIFLVRGENVLLLGEIVGLRCVSCGISNPLSLGP